MNGNTPIIIVAGLPRSGTSMMMRMLEAGGVPTVTDNVRKADEDNPNGYFELEQVKAIRKDSTWLEGLEGKAVKMVSMLLFDLPAAKRYKIVFMRRNMQEVLASQGIMLNRRNEAERDPQEMARLYEKHLGEIETWLHDRKNVETLFVNYNELVRNPREIVPLISRFFGSALNTESMIAVVDPSLYRQRSETNATDGSTGKDETSTESQAEKELIEDQLKSLGYM